MSFIRTKKFNGNDYAYLVENKWYKRRVKGKGKGSRQKVSKYLGRVYSFDKVNDGDFLKNSDDTEQYLENNSKGEVVKDLIQWELFRHNIDNKEYFIDFDNKKVIRENKEISLRINEGFLNSYTLNRLFNLNSNDSYSLARSFVEAGIDIPKEVFAGVFGR